MIPIDLEAMAKHAGTDALERVATELSEVGLLRRAIAAQALNNTRMKHTIDSLTKALACLAYANGGELRIDDVTSKMPGEPRLAGSYDHQAMQWVIALADQEKKADVDGEQNDGG